MPVGLTATLSSATRAAIAAAVVLLAATACGGTRFGDGPSSPTTVRLTLHPSIARLSQQIAISVHGVGGSAVEARLAGATNDAGDVLPWTHLSRLGSSWHGVLRSPALLGVYLVELRLANGDGGRVLESDRWLMRVFRPGTLSLPSFATPEGVARDWVAHQPGHAVVVAMRRWPRPGFDHRDQRLHQLLVLAYTQAGDRVVADRLGIFVTAVRNGFTGRWRLLEATAQP